MASSSESAQHRFAFIFPMASGHINPSLPLARQLVKLGHQVHYLCREQMRDAIEDTGATFHSDLENAPEMYEGRKPDLFGAMEDVKKEYGLEGESMIVSFLRLREIMLEKMIPGVLRWLKRLQADVVVYCPMLNAEAAFAGKVLGIPRVALLTTAGPGSSATAISEMLTVQGLTPEAALEMRQSFLPLRESIARLEADYGLTIEMDGSLRPLGKMDAIVESSLTLVTTCEALQDPMSAELASAYRAANVKFEAVGPLLDVQGARRAAGHKFREEAEQPHEHHECNDQDVVALLREARSSGRKVVLVSMGTVITGDSDFGWDARPVGVDGKPQGLTGRELCRAAWGGAFDAFGEAEAERGALLLVALGPQPNALGDLEAPPNAVCLPIIPQVDVLKAGVDLFLTHGGQNSFTEALSTGVPVVVCPGFGDQVVNARKAVDIGVGLQVERPMPAEGEETAAAAMYRDEVAAALRMAMTNANLAQKASHCARQLRAAGGVPRAVSLLLGLAAEGPCSKCVAAPESAAAARVAGA